VEALLDPVCIRWQAEIECDHSGMHVLEHGEGTGSILCHKDLKVLSQGPLHLRARVRIIVDDKEFG
jgi:hypothetical protein